MTRDRLKILATGLDLPICVYDKERTPTSRELAPKIRTRRPKKGRQSLRAITTEPNKSLYEKRRRVHGTKIVKQEAYRIALQAAMRRDTINQGG